MRAPRFSSSKIRIAAWCGAAVFFGALSTLFAGSVFGHGAGSGLCDHRGAMDGYPAGYWRCDCNAAPPSTNPRCAEYNGQKRCYLVGTSSCSQTGQSYTHWFGGADGHTHNADVCPNLSCTPATASPSPSPMPTTANPDYIVFNLTRNPPSPAAGQRVTFSGTVKNQGNASAISSSQTRFRLNLNSDTTTDWNVSPSNQATSALAAGSSETETWSNVWTATAGTHTMEICADVTRTVPESSDYASDTNPGNNCTTKTFVVSGTTTSGSPDYIVTGLATSPGNIRPGQSVSFSATAKNQGSAAATSKSSTRLRFDVGNNGTWDIPVAFQETAPLASGGSEVETWPNHWTAVAGTHMFEVCADVSAVIVESSEANNCTPQTFVVSSSASASPSPSPTSSPSRKIQSADPYWLHFWVKYDETFVERGEQFVLGWETSGINGNRFKPDSCRSSGDWNAQSRGVVKGTVEMFKKAGGKYTFTLKCRWNEVPLSSAPAIAPLVITKTVEVTVKNGLFCPLRGEDISLGGGPTVGTHADGQGGWESENGMDVYGPVGKWTWAIVGGRICNEYGLNDGYGYRIHLCGGGDEYFYTHMGGLAVNSGQRIKAGDHIGKLGDPGEYSEIGRSHLHISIRDSGKQDELYAFLDRCTNNVR